MVPADNLTYATIQRSVLDLAKNYGFTHCDTSAVECLTSAVFHYMQQVSTDTKFCAELAGRSTACSSDVILSAKNNRLDVETLNQYMIWNEPIKTSTELPQYPVILPERPESPISDNELKEREEKDIPKFAPSIRIKPKIKKLPEEPVEEEEEENIDELTLAAMKISSSIKPITHASKNVDDFDRLNLVLSETLPNFDHYSGKYEHEIDFLGSSAAAQEAAAANAAVKEQMRLEEEEHRQKILEQEKLQYQESQYYQQPEEPMIDFEDARQQKMVEFSKQFIPELTKPEIQKEEEEKHLRIESPIISTLAEDLYVSPSPSPPPEEKPSYSQEPPPLKPISSPIHSEPIPSTTVHPTSINDQNGNPIPINDIKNENSDIKNVEKEKHKKKHKHHKEKRREKEKKKEEEAERQREEEKKNKKDKHKEKKKEKKKEREKDKDNKNEKEKERGKHREKVKEQQPLLLPLQPPKLQPPSKITTNMSQNIAPESVIKASSTSIIPKKSEKEQKKKEKKSKDLKPLKEPEILPMEKLKPPSLKFRFPQSDKSVPSRPPPPPPPIEPSATITPNLANISGSSTSSKGSTKAQPSYKSSADESRPHKKIKDKEKVSGKERDKEKDKEKDKSLKRKHKDESEIIMTPNMKESMKNDGEKEHKIPKLEKEIKRDKDKKEKDRTNETPQEREERKRLKKEKKKREKEKRKRKLEPSSNDNNSGEPEQKKQKISERQPQPLPPSENKSIKIKISLPIRPPPPPTAATPPPPILAPAIPSLPIPTKVENVSKPPTVQSVAKSVPQSFSSKLPPPTSTSKTSTTSSKSTSSGKRPSSSKSSSSSSRHHSSKKDKDETYRSSNTESALSAPKIMSERQQMSKALKESMQTANLTPSSSSLSRSDRHSYEQRKKKRPDKEKSAAEKGKNGNLSLPSSLGPSAPSLPPELPPSQTGLPSNESPPKLEISAPTAENAEKTNDDEEVYSWCPNCGIRYVDGDNMVCCDQCHYWYHWSCVGFYSEPQEDKWFCFKCTGVADKEMPSTKAD